LRFITPYFVIKKIIAPKPPAMAGAMAHAAKTWDTPFQPQLTPSGPSAAIPTPMTPPTMQCLERL
jgi:hypothetical protein